MFSLAQAGAALQAIATDGTLTTLTLPSGITIGATTRGRFVVFGRQVFFVNAPTVNLWIDPFDLAVRPMNIAPPLSAPTLAAGAGVGLTGVYRAQVAYYVKNGAGEIVNQSPLSPLSIASAALANNDLLWTNIPVCPNASQYVSATSAYIFGRRLYRTAAGGTDTFEDLDLDDNTTTSINDSLPDASLALLPASQVLGVPPGTTPGTALGLIVEWKNRLWAVSTASDELDIILFTDIDEFYNWNPDNTILARPVGADSFGVTGFLPRRDFLGIGKRDRLIKVIGSTPEDFDVVTVAEKVSCCAPESCVVIRDVGYFLGLDGVYRWDDDGVVNISRPTVDPWFTTDSYFNRTRFPNAFGAWNPVTNSYLLHLAALGSSVEDRWIEFQIDKGEWLGPHRTGAFTPSCAALLEAASSALLPTVGGSDGYLYLRNQTTPSDVPGGSAAVAINTFFETKWHADDAPDVTHNWGLLSVLSRIESAGATMTVTPYVGRLDAAAKAAITIDLTKGRQRLRRPGVGPLCKLKFAQNVVGKRFLLYGYELPVFEVGVR